ncbi:hypothetical protein FOZ62_016040, partial [Perkinsus olseni]
IMIPRERDLTFESEQAMWNYFRACLGLLCAIGVITYMYFSFKPKKPAFYEPSYIAHENPPLPPTLASGGPWYMPWTLFPIILLILGSAVEESREGRMLWMANLA